MTKRWLFPLMLAAIVISGDTRAQSQQLCGGSVAISVQKVSFTLGSNQTSSETLDVTPASLQEFKPGYTHDGTYTLRFSIQNYFISYPGYYTATISYGSQELCEISGWGDKAVTEITLACPSPGYLVINDSFSPPDASGNYTAGPPQGTSNFILTFRGAGWPTLFSGISFAYTPSFAWESTSDCSVY